MSPHPVLADDSVRLRLIAKLRILIRESWQKQPPPGGYADESTQRWAEESVENDLSDLFAKAHNLLLLHGLKSHVHHLDSILSDNRKELFRQIQEGPEEGNYLVLTQFENLLDNVLFAFADTADLESTEPIGPRRQLDRLLGILRNFEAHLRVTQSYPVNELALERTVEGILACTFPEILSTVSIPTPLKVFKPDTGVKEAKALIDYKFMRRLQDVALKTDEVGADIASIREHGWDWIIFMVYEKGNYSSDKQWVEQFKHIKHARVILIHGQ